MKNKANVAAVNSEGDIPADITEDDDMKDFLEDEIASQGKFYNLSYSFTTQHLNFDI